MNTERGGEQMAEIEGPDGDKFYGAYLLDWIALCEDLQDSDARSYWSLRSLLYDNRGHVNRVRVLSLAEMCQLLLGPGGKPSSLSRVRGMLDRLSKVGLVSTPEGGPVKTSSRGNALGKPLRLKIHDRPCNGYMPRWQNTDDKLKAIQTQVTQATRQAAEQDASRAREERAKRAGQNSGPRSDEVPAGQNSGPQSQNSGPQGQNSGPHPAADQQDREPYSFPCSPSFSLLPPAAGVPKGSLTPPATATDEREIAASQNHNDLTAPEPADVGETVGPVPAQRMDGAPVGLSAVEQVLAAYEQALGGTALNGTRAKLLAAAEELLAARPLWWVLDRARELPQWGDDLMKHAGKSKAPFAERKPAGRPKGLPPVDPNRKKAPMPAHIAALRASVQAGQVPAPAVGPAVPPAAAPPDNAPAPRSVSDLLASLASPNI